MKFLHTSDLHIGKIVNGFSMLEDQRFVLKQILETAQKEQTQAIILAGDIYDRAIPPAEAVNVLDEFLTECIGLGITVLMIGGNHDSPERLGFGEAILEKQRLFIASGCREELKEVILQDDYGKVHFVLLPFIKPAAAGYRGTAEAVEGILAKEKLRQDFRERYVLATHFFITDAGKMPELSDSESTVNVGGLDNVDAGCFREYDYVALGHIHKPQQIGDKPVFYAGSPLKYSFSEVNHTKRVLLVEMREKGDITIESIPLRPLHDMRVIRGKLEELMRKEIAALADSNDYIQAVLTDMEELADPIGSLRSVYPNVMQLKLAKNESKKPAAGAYAAVRMHKEPLELFADFYRIVREDELSEEQLAYVKEEIHEAD